jgi:hypothetical protein
VHSQAPAGLDDVQVVVKNGHSLRLQLLNIALTKQLIGYILNTAGTFVKREWTKV